jgi:Domain of unknown function (DUF4430)
VSPRLVALALAGLVLAGCGGGRERGTARLWITRDRGATVLYAGTVPAGLTAMQALQRRAKVTTRYGGRFVQSIDGLEGNLGQRHDWFYFVNGYEANRGAVEYRLRPGDLEWWDYRDWTGQLEVGVVVGAFPEPFRHGWAGDRRPAAVRYESPRLRRAARVVARGLRAASVAPATVPAAPESNVLVLSDGPPCFEARLRRPGAGSPVVFRFSGDPRRLLGARPPGHHRYRERSCL